jgi:ankyrin repeat protein
MALRYQNRPSRVLARSTALTWAACEGYTPVVKKLIAAGAALDVHNVYG